MNLAIKTALAATLLAACGQATDAHFPGTPLLTVQGQLTLAKASSPAGPIRLAIVWFPRGQLNLLSAPQAIVTSDISYQGSFPLDYTFELFAPPPASALSPITSDGVTLGYGEGVLVAYEDLNGDGQLDSIPAGGAPIDHILGTSIGDTYNGLPADHPIYIDYVDGTPPASWGVPAGYSLIDYTQPAGSQVLPASTPVPLNLVDTNELDFLLCSAACDIAPTGGVRVSGQVALYGGVPYASICLTDGVHPLADAASATVAVNGAQLAFAAADSCFEGSSGFALQAPGNNQVDVALDGHAPWSFQVALTGDFSLQAPTYLARGLAGGTLPASWSSASGASWYEVYAGSANAPFTTDTYLLAYGNGAAVQLPAAPGLESVNVAAFAAGAYAEGLGGSSIAGSVNEGTDVEVVAAGQRSFNASLGIVRYAGALSSWAYVQAFSGATAVTQAAVTIDGTALAFSASDQAFELQSETSFLTAGAGDSVAIQIAGEPAFGGQVQVPGDFTVAAPPASAQAGSALALSWSPSAGASGYEAMLFDGASGAILADSYTTATSTSLSVPAHAGPAQLYVAAYGDASDPTLSGELENAFDLAITP